MEENISLNLENTAVIFNADIEGSRDFAKKVSDAFYKSGLSKNAPRVCNLDDMDENASFAVAIGGDGTLLRCARYYSGLNVPVFGFNMGRLGYLSQALPDELDYVTEKIKNKDFRLEERLMLKSSAGNIALNDMVIKKEMNARTSVLDLYINNMPVCSYMADGLIISTPTGSTAYSLSAGGPVVTPGMGCFIIVPICPHTLTARPIVISKDEIVTVKMCKNAGYQITADGQEMKRFIKEVVITKNENCAKLLLLNKDKKDFYRILREKLHWGVAPHKC